MIKALLIPSWDHIKVVTENTEQLSSSNYSWSVQSNTFLWSKLIFFSLFCKKFCNFSLSYNHSVPLLHCTKALQILKRYEAPGPALGVEKTRFLNLQGWKSGPGLCQIHQCNITLWSTFRKATKWLPLKASTFFQNAGTSYKVSFYFSNIYSSLCIKLLFFSCWYYKRSLTYDGLNSEFFYFMTVQKWSASSKNYTLILDFWSFLG